MKIFQGLMLRDSPCLFVKLREGFYPVIRSISFTGDI